MQIVNCEQLFTEFDFPGNTYMRGRIQFIRGIGRAQIGNYAGAIEDLQATMHHFMESFYKPEERDEEIDAFLLNIPEWIKILQDDKNPFMPDENPFTPEMLNNYLLDD